jgi:magnesium chelatase family protein
MARAHAVAVVGITGHLVRVEASIGDGPPGLHLSGLPETGLRETRDRVRAAIINSGYRCPQASVSVSLLPASLPKRGSGFDLAIAAAILAAAGTIPAAALELTALTGELGLDGSIRPVPGTLPAAIAAAAAGLSRIVTAPASAAEAAPVLGISVIAPATLAEMTPQLAVPAPARHPGGACAVPAAARRELTPAPVPAGAESAEVCAAGGHHLLMTGPPGPARTALARYLAAILPPLNPAEVLEVIAIHSAAGTLDPAAPLITRPPLRAPPRTAGMTAIIGGLAEPGAASLAHLGVLYLDQAPEFAQQVLHALRQPLESGTVLVSRCGRTVRFPARFTLVLAASPCPCPLADTCTCSPLVRRRYLARLSGLQDRIEVTADLRQIPAVSRPLRDPAAAAERVAAARAQAAARLADTRWQVNAQVPAAELRHRYRPAPGALAALDRAADTGEISTRSAHQILRVAWTVTDLAGASGLPGPEEIAQAYDLWRGRTR